MSTETERSAAETADADGRSVLEQVLVVLISITAVTHVYAGIVEGALPVLLAGLGFAGGVVLFVRGVRTQLLVLAAIPYTAVQIPLWYVVKAGNYTLVGYVDKVVQVAAVVVLVAVAIQQRR